MLDVHAPEHPIHTYRDFFLHLFTITCGLVIALGLEDAAEALHHRHQRKEVEVSIREEIAGNRKDLLEAAPKLVEEIKEVRALLAFATARSNNQPAEFPANSVDFNEAPIADSAWRTASSTGTVQWLPYAEVQRFSVAYKEQDLLQATAEQTLSDFFELSSFTPAPKSGTKLELSPEAAREALPLVRRTLAHLQGIYAIGVGTVASYDEALK